MTKIEAIEKQFKEHGKIMSQIGESRDWFQKAVLAENAKIMWDNLREIRQSEAGDKIKIVSVEA